MDTLAMMVAKGFSGVDYRLDKVDSRLEKVESKLDKVEVRLDGVEKKMDAMDISVKATRREVLNVGDRFVPRHEFDSLLVRFNNLEKKIKEKSK